MISGALIWSGLFVSSFIAIFIICWFAIFLYRYQQLKKFKVKGGSVFEQNTIFYTSTVLFSVGLVCYLIALISGIVFLANEANGQENYIAGLLFEILFLVYMAFILVFLVVLLLFQNTIILVFKNDTLLTLNEMINANNIVQIRRDNKRHWIFINWKDENQKRIREIKLKYTYKVKDYLKSNGLWQEQEPII